MLIYSFMAKKKTADREKETKLFGSRKEDYPI